MKTALILTGHMRCWEQVFPNTKTRILDRWNPDVFIATWDNEGYWTSPENDPEGNGIVKESPKLDVGKVIDAYQPKGIQVLNQELYDEELQYQSKRFEKISIQIRPKNIVSQFYMQMNGLKMWSDTISDNNLYDLVIRMRPDIIFPEELPDFNPAARNVLNHPNHEGKGVGDMFLATNSMHMWLYYSDLKMYDVITSRLQRFCPHMITEDILKKGNMIVHDIPKIIQHTPNGQYKDWKK